MRTFALIGAAALGVALLVPQQSFGWTAEQQTPSLTNGVDLSDPDNFKALQDKVNGKTSESGFQFSGSMNAGDGTQTYGRNPYGIAPMNGPNSAFSYSPMPGFRGAPQ